MDTRTQAITTADQLLQASAELDPCELVRGELIMMTPVGSYHAQVEDNIYPLLSLFVRTNKLGKACPSDAGFLLERYPDTVRVPDIGFIRRERVPSVPPQGYFPGAPDLAVEIRSPNDRPGEVDRKIQEYLTAGTIVVWDVDPTTKTVTVHRKGAVPRVLGEDEILTEEDLLPGFSLAVKDVFVW